MFGQNASIQAFMVILRQHRNKILAAFLVFQKRGLRYANNRPGTGTSHIIGQNLWAKFGVTQRFDNIFFLLSMVKGPEAPIFTGPERQFMSLDT